MTANNSASRLLDLIEAGKKEKKERPSSEAWSNILNVPTTDKGVLLARIGHAMALPDLIRSEIEQLDHVNHDLHLKWLPKVEASFSVLNFQLQWKHFIERFDGEIIYGIQICADALSRQRPEKVAQPELLQSLLKQVVELLDEVPNAELPPDLRNFIYEHLSLVRNAVEEYKIRGIKPLETEVERLTGVISLSPWLWSRSHQSEVGRRFWKVMGNLAVVTTIVVGQIQIGKEVFDIFSGELQADPLPRPPIEIIINDDEEGSTRKLAYQTKIKALSHETGDK